MDKIRKTIGKEVARLPVNEQNTRNSEGAFLRLKDGSIARDIAWSYRDPIDEIPKIKGLIAFYPQAVDRIELDGETVS